MAGTPGRNVKRIISLTSLGVMVLVIVIAANVVVWKNNRDKQAQISVLNNEISQLQHKIKGTPAPSSDLVSRLTTAKVALAEAQKVLPGAINLNDVIDYIIDVAEQCQVQAVPLVSEGLAPDSNQSYQVSTFSVTVTGSLENAMNYMTSLQGSKFPTLFITDCIIDKTEVTDYTRPENSTQVTVNLVIAVYTSSPPTGEDAAS